MKNGWNPPRTTARDPQKLISELAARRAKEQRPDWIERIFKRLEGDANAKQRIWEAMVVLPDDVLSNLYWLLDDPRDTEHLRSLVSLAIHERTKCAASKH